MKSKNALSNIEIKEILLFILKIIIDSCRQNKLTYYVYGGTLIGTVRHHGFIPWDDDIDICMPRPDYDKLYGILKNNPYVSIFNCEYNKNYTHTYIKVADNSTMISIPNSKDDKKMGINIDVFPMDALGNTYDAAKHRINRFAFMRSIATMANLSSFMRGRSQNTMVRIARMGAFISSRVIISNRLHVWINRKAKKLDYTAYKYVGSLVDATYREKEIFQREWFGEGIEADFEFLKVNIPNNTHEILTHMYGDYMMLPPEEKRVAVHDYSAYYID